MNANSAFEQARVKLLGCAMIDFEQKSIETLPMKEFERDVDRILADLRKRLKVSG